MMQIGSLGDIEKQQFDGLQYKMKVKLNRKMPVPKPLQVNLQSVSQIRKAKRRLLFQQHFHQQQKKFYPKIKFSSLTRNFRNRSNLSLKSIDSLEIRLIKQRQSQRKQSIKRRYNFQSLDLRQQSKKQKFIIQYATRTYQGKNINHPEKKNQDSYIAKLALNLNRKVSLFAVADGHGYAGQQVSQYIKSKLINLFEKQFIINKQNITKTLVKSFQKLQKSIQIENQNAQLSGSTLAAIIICYDNLYTANVGDSRAMIAVQKQQLRWQVSDITKDHKPNVQCQKQRILRAGGQIYSHFDQCLQPVGPLRVWLKGQSLPGLAMSRSIGDNLVKKIGVICTPQINKFKLQSFSQFIFIATDGIWDYLQKQDITKLAVPHLQQLDIQGACDHILKVAVQKWTQDDDSIVDDITFILIQLTPIR